MHALVELFEGIESAHGGNLDEDRRSKRIEYAGADGTRIHRCRRGPPCLVEAPHQQLFRVGRHRAAISFHTRWILTTSTRVELTAAAVCRHYDPGTMDDDMPDPTRGISGRREYRLVLAT